TERSLLVLRGLTPSDVFITMASTDRHEAQEDPRGQGHEPDSAGQEGAPLAGASEPARGRPLRSGGQRGPAAREGARRAADGDAGMSAAMVNGFGLIFDIAGAVLLFKF